jgi:hypothetical protein
MYFVMRIWTLNLNQLNSFPAEAEFARKLNSSFLDHSSPPDLTIAIMEIPPVPEKPFVVGDITNNSLSIVWEVHGNVAQITHYSVFFRKIVEATEETSSWEQFVTDNTNHIHFTIYISQSHI